MSTKTRKTIKIEIFESIEGDAAIATFSSRKQLAKYMAKHPSLRATQIAINGVLILGFDEIGF